MPDSSSLAIQAKNVSKLVTSGSDTITILQNINLSVKPGEHIAIIGPSGSGKTTLLSLLATLDSPTSGQIYLQGVDITELSEEQRTKIRADHIGFVFQNFHLLPTLNALENITLPLELKGIKSPTKLAKHWLDKVNLGHRQSCYPSTLSGGEMQRIAIARAFALNPSILFVDEPTANLDPHAGDMIADLLFSINDANCCVILVTHNEKLAQRTHKVYQLIEGCLT